MGTRVIFFNFMIANKSFYVSPEMERFVAKVNHEMPAAMKTLLTDDDRDGVVEILANITLAFLLKDKKEVVPEDEGTASLVRDEAAVADALAGYVSFVCAYNLNFAEADFEWLYEECWRQYFKYLESRMDDYAFDGLSWKECWKWCLFMG